MKGFIEQAFKGNANWALYLVGVFIIFVIWQIGAAIQGLFVFLKLMKDGLTTDEILEKLSDMSVLMGTLESNFNFFLLLLGFVFGFGGIILVIRLLHNLKLKHLITSREKIDWNRIGLSFGVIAVLISGSIVLDYKLSPDDYQYNFELNRFLVLAAIGILMVPIQTTFEELLFRGYLMQGFGSVFKSRAVALILTSVLFGGLHVFNPEVAKLGYQALIVYIGTGFFLGIVTLMDEGLELAIGFHAGNNLITALLVTADWTAFKTHSVFRYLGEPSLVSDVYIPVLVFYPILIFIFAKIYKWKNWKQKLFGKIEQPKPNEV
ncbi:MAG: CPBP family intramembrane metalloprotease [Bacteroidetes bacterium]|jgi:membrane protease YdiL (CAAX protease family)|nr:CPBP family intramembrane metalloprotease [Bacteroidota bacterium]